METIKKWINNFFKDRSKLIFIGALILCLWSFIFIISLCSTFIWQLQNEEVLASINTTVLTYDAWTTIIIFCAALFMLLGSLYKKIELIMGSIISTSVAYITSILPIYAYGFSSLTQSNEILFLLLELFFISLAIIIFIVLMVKGYNNQKQLLNKKSK